MEIFLNDLVYDKHLSGFRDVLSATIFFCYRSDSFPVSPSLTPDPYPNLLQNQHCAQDEPLLA